MWRGLVVLEALVEPGLLHDGVGREARRAVEWDCDRCRAIRPDLVAALPIP